MKFVARFTLVAVSALSLFFNAIPLAADEPKFEPPSVPLGKPLKLRTVEALPGPQSRIGPSVGGVTLTVLDGTNATRSKTLWKAITDERGEVVWSQSIQVTGNDPAIPRKRMFVRASKPGYQSTTRPIDPAAGEEMIALSKFVPWMVRAIDAQTKEPIPTFTVMNRMLTNLTIHYGPTTAQRGEALAGFFTENTIRPRELTIEAPGYETFRIALTPELGATNTYELKRESTTP